MLKPAIEISPKQAAGFMVLAWVAVIAYKFNDLFLPYYWDEMAGYMSGILYMADHGISLLPSAVPPQMSYGHPLLLHVCMAAVLKLFGAQPFVMHSVTMLFTLLLSAGTYLLAFQVSRNRLTAMLAFLIFISQPVILAQSTQVLLEMFLCMHTVFAILFYLRKQYWPAILFCTAGILTKETGLVLAIAFFAHILLELMLAADKKALYKRLLMFSMPFLVFAGFLMLTNWSFGWYLNPVNVGKSKLEFASMLQKIWDYPLEFTFVNQGRYYYTILLLLSLVLLFAGKAHKAARGNMDVVLLIVYCFGFLLFSSIADALERYFLLLMPFAALVFAMSVASFRRYNRYLPLVLCAGGIGFGLLHLESSKRYTEVDMGYRHMIRTNQSVFNYVNSHLYSNDTIGFAFPFQYAPADPRFGYYKEKHFTSDTSFSISCAYKVYTSPGNMDWNPPDTARYTLVKSFHSGYSGAYLYKRRSIKEKSEIRR